MNGTLTQWVPTGEVNGSRGPSGLDEPAGRARADGVATGTGTVGVSAFEGGSRALAEIPWTISDVPLGM